MLETQKISDIAVNTYPCPTRFVLECFMTQEMCDKAINRYFLYFILFLINIKFKKRVTVLFLKIIFVPDQYKTQQMCDKAVDDYLAGLKCF